MQAEQLLCWSGMTDTEPSITSGSNEVKQASNWATKLNITKLTLHHTIKQKIKQKTHLLEWNRLKKFSITCGLTKKGMPKSCNNCWLSEVAMSLRSLAALVEDCIFSIKATSSASI